MNTLNLFAQKFAAMLFNIFPEWRAFIEPPTEAGADWLRVRVPSPLRDTAGDQSRDLVIETRDSMVIITCGLFRSGRFRPLYPDCIDDPLSWERGYVSPLEILSAIISEEACMAAHLAGSKVVDTRLMRRPYILNSGNRADGPDRMIVQSWKGTFDCRYQFVDGEWKLEAGSSAGQVLGEGK